MKFKDYFHTKFKDYFRRMKIEISSTEYTNLFLSTKILFSSNDWTKIVFVLLEDETSKFRLLSRQFVCWKDDHDLFLKIIKSEVFRNYRKQSY